MPSDRGVLVLAPVGRDAKVASAILAEKEIKSHICATLDEAVPLLDHAKCLVVAEEALIGSDRGRLSR